MRQLSIDAIILRDGQEHGAPLGRVEREAWVIEKGAAFSVRAKLPEALAGRIELNEIALDAPVLSGPLKFWRRYSSMLMRDVQIRPIGLAMGCLNRLPGIRPARSFRVDGCPGLSVPVFPLMAV